MESIYVTNIINGSLGATFELREELSKLFSRTGHKFKISAFLLLKCIEGARNNPRYFVFSIKRRDKYIPLPVAQFLKCQCEKYPFVLKFHLSLVNNKSPAKAQQSNQL